MAEVKGFTVPSREEFLKLKMKVEKMEWIISNLINEDHSSISMLEKILQRYNSIDCQIHGSIGKYENTLRELSSELYIRTTKQFLTERIDGKNGVSGPDNDEDLG